MHATLEAVFALLQDEALVALAVAELILFAIFHSRIVNLATRFGRLDPMTRHHNCWCDRTA